MNQPLRYTPVTTAARWTQEQRADAMRDSIKHQQDLIRLARQALACGNATASREYMNQYRSEHTTYQWLARVQLNNTTTNTGA